MSKRTAEGFTTLNDILDEDGIREEAEREARSMSKDVKIEQRHRDAARQFILDEWPSWDADSATVCAQLQVLLARFESTLRAPAGDVREAVDDMEDMAHQKLSGELNREELEQADWRGGYDAMVLKARAIHERLSLLRQPEQGREGETPAEKIGRMATEMLELAPSAGVYIGIKITPSAPVDGDRA